MRSNPEIKRERSLLAMCAYIYAVTRGLDRLYFSYSILSLFSERGFFVPISPTY